MRHRYRWTLVLTMIFLVLLLSGCNMNAAPDPRNGFWDAFFVYPITLLIEWFHALLWGSYGLAILAVTIIIRLLLLPLAVKQTKSMAEAQKLQPEIMKIREKYKKEPQKMNEAVMKLYQEHDVNPMAGCLPTLVQLPILFGLYHAVLRDPNIKAGQFLWLALGSPDHFFILPILAGLSQFFSLYVTYKVNPMYQTGAMPQAASQMKMMMVIMPFFIIFIAWNLPSALPLYWVYTNLMTALQAVLLRNYYHIPKVEEASSK